MSHTQGVEASELHPRFAATVPSSVPIRRILVFLGIAFGINSLPAVYFVFEGINLTAGTRGSTRLLANGLIIFASFSPAMAHLITRWVFNDSFTPEELLLGLNFRGNLRLYAIALTLPFGVAIVGAVIYFAVFPGHLSDHPLRGFLMAAGGLADQIGLLPAVGVGVLGSILSVIPAALIVLGEEFGWRAYLLPKLLPLGRRWGTLIVGIIWGVWHWPYVGLGLNYGLEYVGAPWLGLLAIVWVPTLYGVFLAWITFRSGSVWPAAMGHAAFNTSAKWGINVAESTPNLTLGPGTGGLIGSTGWVIVAIWLLWASDVFAADDNH